jgi:hypothetical protein
LINLMLAKPARHATLPHPTPSFQNPHLKSFSTSHPNQYQLNPS